MQKPEVMEDAATFVRARSEKLAPVHQVAAKNKDWRALAEIEAEYHGLLNLQPTNGPVLFLLGTLLMQTDRNGTAAHLLESSVRNGVFSSGPLLHLGHAYKHQHFDEQAAEAYTRAVEAAKKYEDKAAVADALTSLSALYVNAGQPERCLALCEEALALVPDDRFALWNRALADLEMRNWARGFKFYDEAGFRSDGPKMSERKIKDYGGLPRWQGEKGKNVLVYGEQGVGDEVMYASVLPDLIRDSKSVILDADPRAAELFRRSFGIKVYETSSLGDESPWLADHPEIECVAAIGSLCRYYRKKDEDFPRVAYLSADPAKTAKWRERVDGLGDGLKVGLSWVGGSKKTRLDLRSITPRPLMPLLQAKGVKWVSLQYHEWAERECKRLAEESGASITHWQEAASGKDYDETAALVEACDLIVTVNTSLVHLAGALGKKTLCLTPSRPAWRYGVSGPNPFYGSVKMFRQKEGEGWRPIIARVVEYLERHAQKAAA